MIFLLLSILSSSLIFVIFKLYRHFGINTLQAIIFNYFFAFLAGVLVDRSPAELLRVPGESWFPGVLILGMLFISVFYLTAITAQKNGLAVVSVATKLSVAIPVLVGILYYGESTGVLKITGVALAMIAVYLTSVRSGETIKLQEGNLIFPIAVFFGSGIIDSTIKFLEKSFVAPRDIALFSSSIFAIAGLIGIGILLAQFLSGKLRLSVRNLLGGIALGIPNFGSIYFLVMALRHTGMESSTIFPLNNLAIVLVSTILGVLFFHERMLTRNWIGTALAILSIVLIATADQWADWFPWT